MKPSIREVLRHLAMNFTLLEGERQIEEALSAINSIVQECIGGDLSRKAKREKCYCDLPERCCYNTAKQEIRQAWEERMG